MKVAIIGANGAIGSRLVSEAIDRGHSVTAVVRRPGREEGLPESVDVAYADVTDAAGLESGLRGFDAVITAVGGGGDGHPQVVVEAAEALIAALPKAGVKRLLIVGGAGSLETESGIQLVDSPDFPEAWKPASLAQRDALEVYRTKASDLDWTYLSPADVIEPGERTGSYAVGHDRPVVDAAGESRISIEDYAVAMIDELESNLFVGARFTIGYA